MFGNEVVLGIDPGNNLGISVCELNYVEGKMFVHRAYTFSADVAVRNISPFPWESIRDFKLTAIDQEIMSLFNLYPISKVCTENNYMSGSAEAYKSLIECVSTIKHSVNDIDPTIPVIITEAGTIKNSMNVSGNSGDKEEMHRALCNNPNISFDCRINTLCLDEHSVDATAIAYHQLVGKYNQL